METNKNLLTVSCLSGENIDLLSENLSDILSSRMKLDRKEVLRLRLSMEEALLVWRDTLGEDHPVSLRFGKRFGRAFVELSLSGPPVNPFEQENDEYSEVEGARNLLSFYGLAPSYSYKNSTNLLTLMPHRKKPGTILKMIYAFAAAIVFGLLINMLPDSVGTVLADNILQPLFNTFMGLLSAIAAPLIFLSVLWGIYAIGDVSTLGKIGKKMLSRFVIISFIVAILGTAISFWVYDLNFAGTAGTSSQFQEIYQMILNIIPTNLVSPFLDGNSLQIIFLAVVIGLTMLILREKTTVAAQVVEQLNFIVQLIMDAIGSLVPFFIFISVLNMALTGVLLSVLNSLKGVIVCVILSAMVVMVYAVYISVRKKIGLSKLIKKLLPTMLIAITTASSAAAFGTNVETCDKKLGIDTRIVNFGLPTGQVIFMPGAVLMFLSLSLAMAEFYQAPVSISWMLMMIIVATLLGIAAPPIPGGALSCYTILFLQLGLPTEAVVIAIALNTILEFVATASNLATLQLELIILSDSLDMLDTKKLLK